MALLSASQQQSYLNLLNQASLRPKTREVLERGIRDPISIEMLNDFCSRATKIDIAVFQAITNPGPDPKDLKIVSLTEDNKRLKEALQTTEFLEKDKNDCDYQKITAEERVLELEAQLEKMQEYYEELLSAKDNELENTVIRCVGNNEDHHVDQGI